MMYFIHKILTNMFRPLLRPSSLWYYYKSTMVHMWLAGSDNHIALLYSGNNNTTQNMASLAAET